MVAVEPEPRILCLPSVRAIFEGQVDAIFCDPGQPVRLIVYVSSDCSETSEQQATLGVLDYDRDLYYEVSFRGETMTNCRKYTPDNFSHGTALQRFKEEYIDILTDRLPPEIKRKLFGLFLPGDQGLDRHMGGCFIAWVDREGRYRERCIEIENHYL